MVEVRAEISAIRFLVEILLAQSFAQVSEGVAQDGAEKILGLSRYRATMPRGAPPRDEDLKVAVLMTERLAELLGRALLRASEMRAVAGRGSPAGSP